MFERGPQLLLLTLLQPVPEMVQRLDEAVDRRHRRPQLVRRERDEVRLHLIRTLELDACRVLLLEQPDAVERETGERAERPQHGELLAAEVRRVLRRPDEQRAAALHLHDRRVDVRRRPAVLSDDAPLLVADCDRLCAHDRSGRLEHPGGDLLLCRRERHQVSDRLLDAPLLRPPPRVAEKVRRREAEQERGGAHRREQSAGRREP